MKEFKTEMVCGLAFEDLTDDEMMEVDGGSAETATTLLTTSSLPCTIGASIATIGVSIWWFTRK